MKSDVTGDKTIPLDTPTPVLPHQCKQWAKLRPDLRAEMPDSEETPLTEEAPRPSRCAQLRDYWRRLQASTRLVILVAFVSYTLENLLTTTPSTLYPAIVKSVVFNADPNCSKQSAEKLIKGDGDSKCKFEYLNLTFYMGLLVAAKPAAEIILSIVVGNVIDVCGHKGPMLIGCVFNAIGCIGFAFAGNFWWLFATRILQGLGSALSLMCASVLLAATFTDHDELSRSVGIATVGLGLGAVLGWPFGAFTYELLGRPGPFLILAVLCIFDGILRVISSPPVNTKDESRQTMGGQCCGWCSWKIISDPHVLIALFNIFYYSFFISLFATFQPPMVFDRLDGQIWEIGTIVLIALILQVVLQVLTGFVALKLGLWKLTFIGFLCCGVSYIIFTFLTYIWQVLGTELLNRVGHALILSSCFVQYKIATEKRHNMSYGGQMALLSMSYNLGIMLGPLVGGAILKATDYNWLFRGLGISIIVLALPTLIFRKKSNGDPSPASSTTELGDGMTNSTRDDFSDLGSKDDISKPKYDEANEGTPINYYH